MVGQKRRINALRIRLTKLFVPRRKPLCYHCAIALQSSLQEGAGTVCPGKIKQAVNAAGIQVQHGGFIRPCFGYHIALRVIGLGRFIHKAQKIGVLPGCPCIIAGDCIQPKALHPTALPQGDDVGNLCPNVLIVQIQIRHMIAEASFVPPTVRPRHGMIAVSTGLGKVVPLDVGTIRPFRQCLTSLLEPRMLTAGMVHHKIQHHPHAMGIACRN